jgi:hypothetical protein
MFPNKVLLSQREKPALLGRLRWRSGAPKHGVICYE